MKSIVKR